MLDKSIPYIGVLMIKDDPTRYPKYSLPKGYNFSMYKKGYEAYWAKLEVSVDEFNNEVEAKEYFKKEFINTNIGVSQRCIFVKNEFGDFVGTSSLWKGKDFGDELKERIHWLSVDSNHQGKGIAKALISRSLDIYNELGCEGGIYVTSQTWSYKAINIYLDFGFVPYVGVKPINWICKGENFEHENREAWDLIINKISDYQVNLRES